MLQKLQSLFPTLKVVSLPHDMFCITFHSVFNCSDIKILFENGFVFYSVYADSNLFELEVHVGLKP